MENNNKISFCPQINFKKIGDGVFVNEKFYKSDEWLVDVINLIAPEAIVCGPTVLHYFGCQTQIPSNIWVMVSSPKPRIEGVNWVICSNINKFEIKTKVYGLNSLTPQQVIDENYLNPMKDWVVDEDDLDYEEVF